MHTHFRTGKRVLLIYRDGRHEVRKFKERLRDAVLFDEGVRIRVAEIRSISIYKEHGEAK